MDLYLLQILRPWLLLLFIPCWAVVWLMLKNRDEKKSWQHIIEPHLLEHLLVGKQSNSLHPAGLIGLVLSLMVLALSGPAWQKKPVLLSDDQTELVFVLKLTESMLEKDLIPNRLARASFKMQDLLAQRQQLKSALIAYSGSAHLAMPLTTDKQIVTSFAQALEPKIMPAQGDALAQAVHLAGQQFSAGYGTIIVFADSINAEQIKKIQQDSSLKHVRIILYAIASAELLNKVQMKNAASKLNADLVLMSANDSDIKSLLTLIENNFQQAQSEQQEYQDGGLYLLPLIALLILLWFRSGFIAEAWRVS